jgi:hypothetical protein
LELPRTISFNVGCSREMGAAVCWMSPSAWCRRVLAGCRHAQGVASAVCLAWVPAGSVLPAMVPATWDLLRLGSGREELKGAGRVLVLGQMILGGNGKLDSVLARQYPRFFPFWFFFSLSRFTFWRWRDSFFFF